MKKLLGVLIVMFFLPATSNAGYLGKTLTKKSGIENGLYNIFIDDYNKFKKNFEVEIMDYCSNQFVKSAGINQIIHQTRCEYNAVVDLLSKYGLNGDPMSEIAYSWHQNAFPMAKNAAIAVHDCSRTSCKKKIINGYAESRIKLLTGFIKKLDAGVMRIASEENAKYLAKKKKEGPNVGDNEVVAASSGTGFFVSKTGHIVTNYHVIAECKDIKTFYKEKEFIAKTLAVDKINDLAIIKAELNPKKFYNVSDNDPELLQNVIIAGYPLGKKVSAAIKTSKGSITALAGYGDNYSEFQTDAALNPGNSGGPVIDEKGNVIGVAVAAYGKEEGVESFNFGIKVSLLKNFAKANKINLSSPSFFSLGNKSLSDLINEGTIYIECWMNGATLKRLMKKEKSRKAFYSKYK